MELGEPLDENTATGTSQECYSSTNNSTNDSTSNSTQLGQKPEQNTLAGVFPRFLRHLCCDSARNDNYSIQPHIQPVSMTPKPVRLSLRDATHSQLQLHIQRIMLPRCE